MRLYLTAVRPCYKASRNSSSVTPAILSNALKRSTPTMPDGTERFFPLMLTTL